MAAAERADRPKKERKLLTHCKKGHARTPDNLDTSGHCKECEKERRNTPEGKAKIKARNSTPERRAAQRRRYRSLDRKPLNEYQRKRYAKNLQKERDRQSRKYRKNLQKERLRCRIKSHNRRARERAVGGSFTAEEFEILKKQCGNRCVNCKRTEKELTSLGISLSADHIVALSRGGHNGIENIQPLCLECNDKKFTKYADHLGIAY